MCVRNMYLCMYVCILLPVPIVIFDILLSDKRELRLDCLRMFGNLSRSEPICELVLQYRG